MYCVYLRKDAICMVHTGIQLILHDFRFKWSSFINVEEEASTTKDSDVDQIACIVAVTLWQMVHAHMVIINILLTVDPLLYNTVLVILYVLTYPY